MIDLSEFVQNAIRTESRIDEVVVDTRLLEGTIKAYIAIGNILDMLKKNVFYGREIDKSKLRQYTLLANVGVMQIDPNNGLQTGPSTLDIDPRLFHAIVGVATESVELLEALDTSLRTGEAIDAVNVCEELGDVAWYQAIGFDALDVEFEHALSVVISKLRARFPDKYTDQDANERNLDMERAILENMQNKGTEKE